MGTGTWGRLRLVAFWKFYQYGAVLGIRFTPDSISNNLYISGNPSALRKNEKNVWPKTFHHCVMFISSDNDHPTPGEVGFLEKIDGFLTLTAPGRAESLGNHHKSIPHEILRCLVVRHVF